ncbi:MAG: hypothetical protein AAGF12_29065 [Myxococcota bacterium]
MRLRSFLSIIILGLSAALFAVLAAFIPVIRNFCIALTLIYGVGVVALAARFYWARWFARGLGWWGVMSGCLLMYVSGGVTRELLSFTIAHGIVLALLNSKSVIQAYDGQEAWRKELDEKMQRRMANLFTNLGTALPYIAFYALIPRGSGAAEIVGLGLLGAALFGLARGKSWGLLGVGVTAMFLAALGVHTASCSGVLLGLFVAAGFLPFVPTIVRFLRGAPAR